MESKDLCRSGGPLTGINSRHTRQHLAINGFEIGTVEDADEAGTRNDKLGGPEPTSGDSNAVGVACCSLLLFAIFSRKLKNSKSEPVAVAFALVAVALHQSCAESVVAFAASSAR